MERAHLYPLLAATFDNLSTVELDKSMPLGHIALSLQDRQRANPLLLLKGHLCSTCPLHPMKLDKSKA